MPTPSLDDLLRDARRRWSEAPGDRGSPYRTPALCTRAADGAPRVRTVVLRRFDAGRWHLELHSDRRSPKFADIAAEPRVGLLVWDAAAGRQVILSGRAHALSGHDAAAAWDATRPAGRRPYALPDPPGTPAAVPPPLPRDEDGGRENFAVIAVAVDTVECLWLAPEGNRRARFRFPDGAEAGMDATWLTP